MGPATDDGGSDGLANFIDLSYVKLVEQCADEFFQRLLKDCTRISNTILRYPDCARKVKPGV